MREDRLLRLESELLQGTVPDCLPEELAEVVAHVGAALASGPEPQVTKIRAALEALNNERLFAPVLDLAVHWHVHRGFDTEVEKRRVQALIELGHLEDAECLALDALTHAQDLGTAQADREIGEFYGHLGRISKQRFVQTNDLDYLQNAIDWYSKRFRDAGRPYFQGINVVALIAALLRFHAEANIAEDIRPPALAESVLADVLDQMGGDPTPWHFATASEALLALKKCDEAELWLHRFLQHPQTRAFHIESYSRQLREIWQGNSLRNTTCADRLSAVVDRHVMRTQQRWSVSPAMLKVAQLHPQSLEKNFANERTFTVEVIQKMLKQCAGIGCVTDSRGRRLGTGFLVVAADLGIASIHEWVFITNEHVVGKTVVGAIKPDDAWVTFELECAAEGKPICHKISPNILFSSPPGALGKPDWELLDVAIFTLETWPKGGGALRINESLPIPSPRTQVFIVGHPSGDVLQLSLHDSQLLDVCDEEVLLHYRTPTEPGSSGSPVFNTSWEVVALHHAGSQETPRLRGNGSYEANEGISMHAIKESISTLSGSRSD